MSAVLPMPAEAPPRPDVSRVGAESHDGRAAVGPRPGWLRRLQHVLEPTLGDLEPAYRQRFLRADVDQAILGMTMITAPLVFFAFSDYLLLGAGPTLVTLTLVRLALLSLTLAVIWRLRGTHDVPGFDRVVAVWAVTGIVSAYAMNAIRPPTHTMILGIQALALLAMHLVIPSRLSTRLIMAICVITLTAAMQISGRREADLITATQIWATVILTNIMGLTLSSRHHSLRRQQFLARLELERARDELQVIATTDALTGLLTRRSFLELAEQDLAQARRYDRPLSLLAIDLDHFKQVNDRHGHAAGDIVLIAVAQVLRDQTRQHDRVGRIGGEELAVVLPETGLEAARQLAQRIRAHVSALRPEADGFEISVTASLGVAEARADDSSILELLKRADRALYRAKEQGRNRVAAA
jgi:diguanylate cyclase (GGDEF)-like protein